MRAFIPVVRFEHALWSADRGLWEAVYPGWWDLMARTFGGEQVFDDPPTAGPYMIVNLPKSGEERRPSPGLSGTMDITPGRAHVILLSSWGAPADLVLPSALDRERAKARIHDWFNGHHGFTAGVVGSRDREAFGVGCRVQEVVEDAPDFPTLMARIVALESSLRAGDAAARVRFEAEVQALPPQAYRR